MQVESDFIGRTIAFPLSVDHTGGIALVSGPEAIERAIMVVLSTAPGERVMRSEFGCAIWDLLFDPINLNTLGLMAESVRTALGQWEPRIDVENVSVEPDPAEAGKVLIGVDYRVRATNDRRNLVYPFYVIPEEGP
ncbi:MAG: GPW/gp25 family protein [Acidimicrobiales bacterium]